LTPAKVPCSNLLDDGISPVSILDGEIDDAFLREVDVICEQSAVKKEQPSPESMVGDGNFPEDRDLLGDEDPVPRKYYEYLEKLNDAQREAACSDISVPLMIVAGPGSGKV